MADKKEVLAPDLGGEEVEVIEVLVSEGDQLEQEDAMITVESDKASMDIPAPFAGKVAELKVKTGDKISEGDLIAMFEAAGDDEADEDTEDKKEQKEEKGEEPEEDQDEEDEKEHKERAAETETSDEDEDEEEGESKVIEVKVPDIGEADEVEIIEVLVSEGDEISKEDGLITLETDKATMDVPSPEAGVVESVEVSVGDKVKEGSLILKLKIKSAGKKSEKSEAKKEEKKEEPKQKESDEGEDKEYDKSDRRDKSQQRGKAYDQNEPEFSPDEAMGIRKPPVPDHPMDRKGKAEGLAYASPAVRRLAREFGVDLNQVEGSGRKDRILKEDVQDHVKYELSRPKATGGSSAKGAGGLQVIAQPKVDFSKFGEIEEVPLTRIQKISGPNLHRNWVTIPHVTQFDEADITELEAFRKSENQAQAKKKDGIKITPLVFIMKAVAKALQEYPQFNSSLAEDGEHLIMKKYIHLGIAVDTPNGLMVPVVRDVDKKGIYALSDELADISSRARDGKLKTQDMQGGCFSISSLGGIGGTAFTPIVNAPDVAILGVSKSEMKPKWNGDEFEPRLILPLSLSYDHRVIDGALAARFSVYLSNVLSDIRKLVL
ncbi:dihydrolipoamide acetyltransferase [Pseudidiomarina salinarum]|uniref:Acetyltransferase component of pyruvate dehydrogenase complex n=1 Tax=Pseudidiomarina salinarum TaxID=435908 RepID=A0A094IU97_9GAMM|nr:dihydrolipoyllysine-residue acetyltransferase [Pseudidiomarina salinarum]KFZ31255.1 dihydrolipoamide acetyltransferase [Pseudidiomarina salinarum]RUO70996.1 dihydrolipoyllysine-residue acetyltransferase [Pseudidiomarina salinarum]